jgi:hypothetical protein
VLPIMTPRVCFTIGETSRLIKPILSSHSMPRRTVAAIAARGLSG